MRAQFVHLSGPRRGRTTTPAQRNVLVGSDPDARVRFAAGAHVAARHAEVAFDEHDCVFRLRALGGPVFVNRREVREVELADGDLREFGVGGPRLRFHAYAPPGAVCKPVRRMLADAGEVAEHAGVFAFTQSFTRDLLTHATWQLKVFFPLAVLAIVALVAWIAGWFGANRPVRRILERERAAAEAVARIHDELARGVCLIHGIVHFVDERGPTPRFAQWQGERFEIEYTGSGFLVDRAHGLVMSNRHVLQPWTEDSRAQTLLDGGFAPRFAHFTVTFPGKQPVAVDALKVRTRSDELDVAVLEMPTELVADVPELRLSTREPTLDRGHRVFVVGYPTGVRALLGKADRELYRRLVTGPDVTMTAIVDGLAQADFIRPLVTQGALADVTPSSLVYDAETTSGGSGGPVLTDDGSVIGVNYAILRDFNGSNFGVPARFAAELLR
jgi:serine protease Do